MNLLLVLENWNFVAYKTTLRNGKISVDDLFISVEDFFELSISTMWSRSCVMFLESICACHGRNRKTQILALRLWFDYNFKCSSKICTNCLYRCKLCILVTTCQRMCDGAGEHSCFNEAGHIGCACAHHSANRN